jgi:type IV pilus assembly protein PilB
MPLTRFNEEKQKRKLDELRRSEQEALAELLSHKYKIDYINLSKVAINTDALRLIPEDLARETYVAAFALLGKRISIASVSPERKEVKDLIEDLESRGYKTIVYIASESSLEKAWDLYKDISYALQTKGGAIDISNNEIDELLKNVKTVDDITKYINETLAMKKSYRISRVLTIILAGALALKSSDIHIEAEEVISKIRYRLDGVLQDIVKFDKETYNLLLSRIKLLSNLKLNIKDNAQDGRYSIHAFDEDIEIRTSTLPGAYGESVVMRVLNPKSLGVSLEDMGIPPKLYKLLMDEINRPQGMILTTGPTGSGKTTTLYSFMKKVWTPGLKLITIEDPIEYHLTGITQTQIDAKKGYTFADGLRSILRQDPDVIMVGEIRDHETAEIAINSALTGHLVFSTLHTNNAAGAFTRLIDLKANPRILTSAINVAIAQRLVRRLCQECKKELPIPEDKKQIMKRILDEIPEEEKKGLTLDKYYVANEADGGCNNCHHTGYRGRIGVFEAIKTTRAIEDAVNENPSERGIQTAAKAQGILTLNQDGILKVLNGFTSLDELERVIDLHEV